MIVKTTADRISTVVSGIVLYCHGDRIDHPGETIYSPVSNDYWKNALDYYSSSSSWSLPRTRVVMVNDVIADANDKEEFINEWLKKYIWANDSDEEIDLVNDIHNFSASSLDFDPEINKLKSENVL